MDLATYRATHPTAAVGESRTVDRTHVFMLAVGALLVAVGLWRALDTGSVEATRRSVMGYLGSFGFIVTGAAMLLFIVKKALGARGRPKFGWVVAADELFAIGAQGNVAKVPFADVVACRVERGPGRVTRIDVKTGDTRRDHEIWWCLRGFMADDFGPKLDGLWRALEPRLREARPDVPIEIVRKADDTF